jgi:hypothetical protein
MPAVAGACPPSFLISRRLKLVLGEWSNRVSEKPYHSRRNIRAPQYVAEFVAKAAYATCAQLQEL